MEIALQGLKSHQPSSSGHHKEHTRFFDIKHQLNQSRLLVLTERKVQCYGIIVVELHSAGAVQGQALDRKEN